MASELQAMREAYEAKLAAAHEAAREAAAAHRKEVARVTARRDFVPRLST